MPPRPSPSRVAAALDFIGRLRDRAGGILNTVASTPGTLRPDEYQERFGLPGDPVPAPREVAKAVKIAASNLTSLDAPQSQSVGNAALDIMAGFTPLQYPQAARDFERSRRESDLLGMGLASLAAVPVVGGAVQAAKKSRRITDVAAEQLEAFATAQRNAAKPISEGGLGLRPDNTAMERAEALGFDPKTTDYHGSLHDIKRVNLGQGDIGAFVGQGFYTTPNPLDASQNYASVMGPDTFSKIERGAENTEKDLRRIMGALSKGKLSPARTEVLLRETGTGENLGVVYPVMVKRGKEANMVDRHKSTFIEPGEIYDEVADEYIASPNANAWRQAFQVFQDFGADPPDRLTELALEGGTLDEIWEAVANAKNLRAYDPDTGTPLTSGGLASEVVKALGANTVTHATEFRNPQLNIAGKHTIALQPTGIVRSKFAAFDPAKITSPDLLAGMVGPTVLAAALMEQERREKKRQKEGL